MRVLFSVKFFISILHPDTLLLIRRPSVRWVGHGNGNELINWLMTHGGAVALDSVTPSDQMHWTHTPVFFTQSVMVNSCPDKVAEVTFTASDLCGNTQSTTARNSHPTSISRLELSVLQSVFIRVPKC